MAETKEKGLDISVKTYLGSLGVIFILMLATFILGHIIPGGEFARVVDEAGNTVIDTAAGFKTVEGGMPFIKWLFSPVLVFTAAGSGSLIAVIIFLLVIGGVFASLDRCGLIRYMLDSLSQRFSSRRYTLLAVLTLFFMAMGALVGSFEEVVPLVPIVVALSLRLGWDAFTGMGMSFIAVGCGFATGVLNPFTVGVAQRLAGLPMFSGFLFRLVSFVPIYFLLWLFVFQHAKSVERPIDEDAGHSDFVKEPGIAAGISIFAGALFVGVALVLSSTVITALQDYTMIIIALAFLAGGIAAALRSGMSGKDLLKSFLAGVKSILPAVLMIMMASSIKYTLEESRILDSILHAAMEIAGNLSRAQVILFIYFLVLVMNFFISSGSAKAFLLIPIIVPIAQVFGISPQLCIVAFAFGDGFSNVFYPTNAALLISLGLAKTSYGEYARNIWRFQLANLVLTGFILLVGLSLGY